MTTTENTRPSPGAPRPVALVTGVGRTVGIGAGIARQLARSGWNIAFTFWSPYDERMVWGAEHGAADAISASLAEYGADRVAVEADLADPQAPERIFRQAERRLGGVTAPVMCHCESVDSGLLDTSVESFDRLGTPQNTAHLVDFLCSPQGQWINGQLLLSNGGLA
jgi:3-oxoacyl-[acyl-carrier protein] reductase